MPALLSCGDDPTEQAEHQAEVLGGDQMKRAAHQPGADDRSFVIDRPRDVRLAQTSGSRPDAKRRGAQHQEIASGFAVVAR